MRIRLLPLLAFVAVLALGMRVEGLWSDFSAIAEESGKVKAEADGEAGATEAEAQAKAEDETVAEQKRVPTPEDIAGKIERGEMDRPRRQSQGYSEEMESLPGASEDIAALPADPFSLTDTEIELLQALARRRETIDLRERELESREALLAAAETRIDEKIASLESLQSNIESLLVQYDEQEERQMASLVKIYEAMKPKEAARIFERLDMPVLLDVVERMKERKASAVLAKMDPAKAKSVTLELAQRRELPLPRE